MYAHILTIGDELLIGQIINTNAAWLGEQLTRLGIVVERMITIGDEAGTIQQVLNEADTDFIFITGGLGPTHDDLTKKTVADWCGCPMEEDATLLEQLEARYAARGRMMPPQSREMARIPAGFSILPNPIGTAPGLWYTTSNKGRPLTLILLPGVPYEMKAIVETAVLPRLEQMDGRHIIAQKNILTAGIGESQLVAEIGDLSDALEAGLTLAFLPNPKSGVRLRLTAQAGTQTEAKTKIDRLTTHLRHTISPYIYGEGTDELETIVGQILKKCSLTLAVAESCTGGLLGDRLTNVSGASDYFSGGVIAYANQVKIEQLGVEPAILTQYGAVSKPVVRQMAEGVRRRFGTDIGVSITGVAGPSGGTPSKPVGTVWIGYADEKQVYAQKYQLAEERRLNKILASTMALNLMRLKLIEQTA